mmetsp:Transcript_21211/g.35567  ORF Transcript_21211/g.35567 Transcript_21211/m.35567 type:complete len:192 (-) Transcript_21211:366-941(-)
MGPKAAPPPAKEVPKDDAKVIFVHIHAAPPPAEPEPAEGAEATATSAVDLSAGADADHTAQEESASAVEEQVAPSPPLEFELVVNLICRTDIVIDYIRKQFMKMIQEKVTESTNEIDPDKKMDEGLKARLKEAHSSLAGRSASDLILQDSEGVDVTFKESTSQAAAETLKILEHYTVGIVQEDSTVRILTV